MLIDEMVVISPFQLNRTKQTKCKKTMETSGNKYDVSPKLAILASFKNQSRS